jgi:hypothetical protein
VVNIFAFSKASWVRQHPQAGIFITKPERDNNKNNMDILHQIISPEIMNGIIVSLLTEGAKKIQAIPVNSGQKARVRTLVFGLSFIVTALNAFLDGNLSTSNLIPIIANSVNGFLVSSIVYFATFRKKTS